ncbi:HAD family hydrolase [Paenalkalicoccus suaedae]|nr:HAD family hydrolase [Paenalkalicoccus suaedae]
MNALIFDMDGTLFQTNLILEMTLEDTFNQLRETGEWEGATPIETYRNIMGVPLPKVWATLLPAHSQQVKEQVDAYFLERLVAHIEAGNGALYPSTLETMAELQKTHRIYIASNGLIPYLKAIVDYYGLDEFVQGVYSIDQIDSMSKSDLVATIIKDHDIKSGAVIGDRLSDINAAKDNGLVAIGCRFDFAQEDELAQADVVIEELGELLMLVEKSVIGD